jgi:DNA-binding NtrC family response regulator
VLVPTVDRRFEIDGVTSDDVTNRLKGAVDDTQQAVRALVVAPPGEERQQLEMLLGREHILPFVATCCESAIAALSNHPFDIVLSSMALGGPSDGLGLARWILANRPTTGIILLSDTFPWIAASSPLASVPLLVRPLDGTILMDKVRSVVAGQKAPR